MRWHRTWCDVTWYDTRHEYFCLSYMMHPCRFATSELSVQKKEAHWKSCRGSGLSRTISRNSKASWHDTIIRSLSLSLSLSLPIFILWILLLLLLLISSNGAWNKNNKQWHDTARSQSQLVRAVSSCRTSAWESRLQDRKAGFEPTEASKHLEAQVNPPRPWIVVWKNYRNTYYRGNSLGWLRLAWLNIS